MAMLWITFIQLVCVQVTAGAVVNVARGKPTNASSQYGSFDTRGPFKAVDGDTNAVDPTGIITTNTHQQYGAWWVDLQTQVQDPTVKIYFRTDYEDRRASVEVFTSSTPFTSIPPETQPCHTTASVVWNVPDIVTTTNCSGTWQYLMVYRKAGDNVLDFGEVEVWVCSTGFYGANCNKSCDARQCASTSSCDGTTGVCNPAGCKAGYMTPDCAQECPPGTYGDSCNKLCSSRYCQTPSTCNYVTGNCSDGCQAGWKGTDCITACTSETYGTICEKSCSNRQCRPPSTSCDLVTGKCLDGCADGWRGEDCTTKCPKGTYGDSCVKSCSARQCSAPSSGCDHETGQCPDGCLGGWSGGDCTEACDREHYGQGCAGVCGTRHSQGASSCNFSSGQCDAGCQAGWTGTDCTERALVMDQTAVVAGSVSAVVIVIIVIVIIGGIVWRRKRPERKASQRAEHAYCNSSSPTAKVEGEVSEVEMTIHTGEYDRIDDVVHNKESTYNTIDNVDKMVATSNVTSRDEYEQIRTYEKLDATSRDHDENYTGIKREGLYQNVERTDIP